MQKSDFFYELPKRLIAQQPIERRDGSRLMVLDRATGQVTHRMFMDIIEYLNPGDCIVINDSRVIPARLAGEKVEFLLHERLENNHWTALAKPGKKAQPGAVFSFGGGRLSVKVVDIVEGGLREVELTHDGELEPLLEEIGDMPLPHYIEEKQSDLSRYQTVYAQADPAGASVAAPTAGLHFTEALLEDIQNAGISIARVTLHVGIGTFRPVKTADITQHHMHSEYCRISPENARIINEAKEKGGRVIAVGTTSCRTLESRADVANRVCPGAGKTDIFIYPGYTFRIIDGLLTNFHLPESTLIMLVAALAGRENILAAYNEAVAQGYRFFSYGDCMAVL